MTRVVVGRCENCGRDLRVKEHAVKPVMHLTCKCGASNRVTTPQGAIERAKTLSIHMEQEKARERAQNAKLQLERLLAQRREEERSRQIRLEEERASRITELSEKPPSRSGPRPGAMHASGRKDVLRTIARALLASFHFVIPLSLTFDLFIWWRFYRPAEPLGLAVLIFVLLPLAFFLPNCMEWPPFFDRHPRIRKILGPRFLAYIILCVDSLFVSILLLVTVYPMRSIRSESTTLYGYFAPNGRVIMQARIPVPSINNLSAGELTLLWNVPGAREETIETSQQVSSGFHSDTVASQSLTTTVRALIRLPQTPHTGSPQPLELSWTLRGSTTVFASGTEPGEVRGGGPGGRIIPVYVTSHEFSWSSESISIPLKDYWLVGPLVSWKETGLNGVALWLSLAVLLVLTYVIFSASGIIE